MLLSRAHPTLFDSRPVVLGQMKKSKIEKEKKIQDGRHKKKYLCKKKKAQKLKKRKVSSDETKRSDRFVLILNKYCQLYWFSYCNSIRHFFNLRRNNNRSEKWGNVAGSRIESIRDGNKRTTTTTITFEFVVVVVYVLAMSIGEAPPGAEGMAGGIEAVEDIGGPPGLTIVGGIAGLTNRSEVLRPDGGTMWPCENNSQRTMYRCERTF